MNKNMVAQIIKVDAWLNGLAGFFIGADVGKLIGIQGAGFFVCSSVIVVSFLLYCIGEGLQLLEDIKTISDDTRKQMKNLTLETKDNNQKADSPEDISELLPEV